MVCIAKYLVSKTYYLVFQELRNVTVDLKRFNIRWYPVYCVSLVCSCNES